ncbi:MAG TPA: glycosyltransferase, partial [Gemmatimonadaceae bacterium]|nr:glycosyltransferase [Gemmatimonadaceae bacterium]
VASRGIRISVALVGKVQDEQYWNDCRQLAETTGVTERLLFLGERADAIDLTADYEIGIVPSRSDSGPLVLIEMLGAGLPVAAFRTGEVAERAAAAGIGGIVSPGDVAALAAEIMLLAEMSPTERVERGTVGRRLASHAFDLRQHMTKWYDVYMSAISSRT